MTVIRKRIVKQYYQKFYYKDEKTGEIKKGYKAIYKRVRYYLEFPAKFPLEGLIGVELDLKREGDSIIIKPKKN